MSAEFFTRLIRAQEQGPNMQPEADEACLVFYACDRCDEEHEDEEEAENCCKPMVYEVYRCAVCRKKHNDEDKASECCPGALTGQPMQCPVCLAKEDSFEAAADCCLFKHPSISAHGRQRIATAVANGTPWSEAVEANINH